ncbi:MAG: hypothetical protein FWE91_02055 [Defluviitaleaceae bacterium]|nr:hypothetical protein [Defluviitaleaceae bacterium]
MGKLFIHLSLLLCFTAVSLFPGTLILSRANHVHNREGACATCVNIIELGNLLRQFRMSVSGVLFTPVSLLFIITVQRAALGFDEVTTPVKLKIRMNN